MAPTNSPSLDSVLKANLCAGCGLCAGVSDGAIEMHFDTVGFLRPKQVDAISGTTEHKIKHACPGLSVSRPTGSAHNHPIWGPYEEVHIGWSTDEALRCHGSSGAALSAVARHLVKTKKVEFILTIRDDEDDPVSNETHPARSYDDIYRAAGSRYGPSAPLSEIESYLAGEQRFAVVAKPCDISALRALAGIDMRVNEKIPFMLSFFCAGVPSRQGALDVLEKLSVAAGDLQQFQYRGDGWPGKAKAKRRDGSFETMSYHESWGNILSKHVQFRCKVCPDGSGGAADLVCADAWNADDEGYPLFEEDEGRSLVMARTKRGLELMRETVKSGELELSQFDIDNLLTIQPGQTRRSHALLARLIGLFFKKGKRPNYTGFSILKNARALDVRTFARNLIGTFRRA